MSESVKVRAGDGKIYERIAKRSVRLDELHWCAVTGESPGLVDSDTPVHLCGIWKLAEDQTWTPPEPVSGQKPSSPIDELIEKVSYSENLNELHVLGILHQAKALEQMAEVIDAAYLTLRRIENNNPYKTVLLSVVALALLDLLAFIVMVIVK